MSAARPDDQAELDGIKADLAADLEAVALAVLGEPNKALSSKAEWRWGAQGSKSLQLRGARRGSFFDHEAAEGGGVLHLIHAGRRQGWADAIKWGKGWTGRDGAAPQDRPKPRRPDPAKVAAQEAEAAADRARRIAYARDLWAQRQPISGTVAADYLRGRGIWQRLDIQPLHWLPFAPWPDCIAFLPGKHHGLIVASTDKAGAVVADGPTAPLSAPMACRAHSGQLGGVSRMTWTWQTAMDAKLTTFAGWHFAVHCAGCRLTVQLDVDRLRAEPGHLAVAEVVVRLRCSRCGEWPASVALADGHEGDGRADRQRIELLP